MNTPDQASGPSTAPTPVRAWVYRFGFLCEGGHTGYGRIKVGAPLTRKEDEAFARAAITQGSGLNGFVITSLTLLRVEDAAGQVVG